MRFLACTALAAISKTVFDVMFSLEAAEGMNLFSRSIESSEVVLAL